jgi:nitroimidazol reductase NimA-like FMN-containing flavoprotein (pyridoxamine 5'-phosphate oxidase superfamily)
MDDIVAQAKTIIKSNIYMSIATADASGKPWISPVFFAYDESYNLYWVSDKNALHSQNIRTRPQIAIAIFDSTSPEGEGDAVYYAAEATELSETSEISQAMKVMSSRVTVDEFKVKDVSEVTGAGAWRIYKASPQTISKLSRGETVNGQYIDTRVTIQLDV